MRSVGGNVSTHVTQAVGDAFSAAGYDVRPASESPSNSTIVITPSINRFHYWSYNWFWPINLTGGTIDLSLKAAPKNGVGATIWEKKYRETDFWVAFGIWYGYRSSIHKNMTKILGEIRNAAAERSFVEQVGQPIPSTPAPVITERLKALQDLKDSGLLTVEEYEAKRKALLEQL